jgi:hypothetical protein
MKRFEKTFSSRQKSNLAERNSTQTVMCKGEFERVGPVCYRSIHEVEQKNQYSNAILGYMAILCQTKQSRTLSQKDFLKMYLFIRFTFHYQPPSSPSTFSCRSSPHFSLPFSNEKREYPSRCSSHNPRTTPPPGTSSHWKTRHILSH